MNKFVYFLRRILLVGMLVILAACNQLPPIPAATETLGTEETLLPTSKTSPAGPKPSGTLASKATGTPTAQQLDIDEGALRGTIINFWHPWGGETGEIIEKLTGEFNLSNTWNIIVIPEYKGSFDDLSDDLHAAVGSREMPDLAV